MELLSDVVFGNGTSIPGGEDISVLCDKYGFPYYKGGTFKGIFREELTRYLTWKGIDNIDAEVKRLLGEKGESSTDESGKLVFSDFQLTDYVKKVVMEEIQDDPSEITNSLTNIRTFTKIDEDGMTKKGSLRYCRCVNKGLVFFSEIKCDEKDKELIKDVMLLIKWIGTMRNRGFGKVKISEVKEV
ncbi:MAG: hypothetical protein IJM37_10660 [Lachnospiraceae bacterium]|nr:hypothetical protein [Lachnospiraceae bacterium]